VWSLPSSEGAVSAGARGDGGFDVSPGIVHGDCPALGGVGGAGGAEDTASAGGAELGGLTE
jgi:hypothetical protein